MATITISKLKQQAGESPSSATLDVQLQKCVTKTTKSGKPYLEVVLTDSTDQFTLKIWENLPQFSSIQELEIESFLRLDGEWIQNQYGIDGVRWQFRLLNAGEIQEFLSGDPVTRETQERDWNDILHLTSSISDPRLHGICALFIQQHGEHFRRTAAARKNHHARRGGLVEHVAQMMRCAVAISTVYRDLNRDLLIAGVLFHDCGKLWENSYSETGFAQPFDIQGEMLGHIPLGINLADKLWAELMQSPNATAWDKLSPANDLIRIHLIHLIASHHGCYEYGSPTLPRTPEAHALHHIDNLDAKHEMFKQAYRTAPKLAAEILERQFPLPTNIVLPLEHYASETATETAPEPIPVAKPVAAEVPVVADPQQAPIASLPDESMKIEIENDLEGKPFDGELF